MPLIQDICGYAFRGGGKYILLIMVILSAVSEIAGFAPLIGWISQWILFGYFCAMYFKVIETSATGSDEAPDFPEVSSIFEDMVVPAMKVLAVSGLCFGPAFLYEVFQESRAEAMIAMALELLGFVYFPMAMMAVVCLGYFGGVSPHIVLPAIFKAGGLYWLAVFLMAMFSMGWDFLDRFMPAIPVIKFVVLVIFGSYVFLTNGRILGVVYRERREEMGWN